MGRWRDTGGWGGDEGEKVKEGEPLNERGSRVKQMGRETGHGEGGRTRGREAGQGESNEERKIANKGVERIADERRGV